MKKLLLLLSFDALLLLGSGVPAPAADLPAGLPESVQQLTQSASAALAGSIAELNKLREQIASEKLPLARDLTAAEERLGQLRREHDQVSRLVDSGNLEIATIKAEMKARQDELSYIGNLLDEYVRTFESKINISELQYCGAAIDLAKQAPENTTLSMTDRFERQVAFVTVSVKRLFDAIGGLRFKGTGVDPQGSIAEGQFAIVGPVALFRSESGETAGLVVPQSGSTKPLIRPLEAGLNASLAALVEQGKGLLPLDPTRGGALKALVQKTSLVYIFKKGGPIMWPLLIASILALGVVIERVVFLMLEQKRRDPKAMEEFFEAAGKGDYEQAIRIGNATRFYIVRALGYGLVHRHKSLPNALLYSQAQELKRFRRGIPILDTVITLAPLLGLLGTVTGMMASFSLIGGELSAPGAITGGIAEALIATAFGLGIAIVSLIPFNVLNTRMEEVRHEMEAAATQLEMMVHPPASTVAAVAHATHPAEPLRPLGGRDHAPARLEG